MTEKDTKAKVPEEPRAKSLAITYGWQSWAMLIFSLVIVFIATLLTIRSVNEEARLNFNTVCDKVHEQVRYRLSEHARVLWGGSALFYASNNVSRKEWRIFTQRQKLEQQLPGIQGFGFALQIKPEQLASHTQAIRAEGFPNYQIRPDGDREIYTSIIFLEPFSDRNLRAFGYDMFSDPVRRTAMELARDADTVALSDKVLLVQETEANIQAGALMYVPVYQRNLPTHTVEQRRAAIHGWVYSAYRMTDLIEGIFELRNLAKDKEIRLQIFDEQQTVPSSLLFDNKIEAQPPINKQQRLIDFAGNNWTLLFSHNIDGQFSDYRIWLVFSVGSLISLLLFGLINSMLAGRFKSGQVAEQQASSRYARSLIEASSDPMVTISTDGKITDANMATEMATGVSREQLIGSDFAAYFNDMSKAQEVYFQVFEKGSVSNYPLTIRHKSGTLCDVMYNATIYRNEQGKVAGVFAVARDITEQKRAQSALKESETKYRKLFQMESDALFFVDTQDGRILDANLAAVTLYGYELEELLKLAFIDLSEEPEKTRASMTGTSSSEITVIPLLLHRKKDGTVFPVEINATSFTWNGRKVVIPAIRDITERTRLEKAYRDKERQRLAGIIKGTNVGTWEWNIQSNKTVFNERWAEIAGYTLAEISPTSIETWKELSDTDDFKASELMMEQHFNGELDYYEAESRITHKDGRIIWVLDRGRITTWTKDGNPLEIMGTRQDITARKLAEEEIIRSLQEKETLLKEVHHRVKNNMAVISSLLSLQAERIEDPTVKAIFEESQQRVKAMALVHERLYQTENLESINFEYYIRSIVSEIISLHKIDTQLISIKINIENIMLDLETAIPCGLLINELLTNALKHAFHGHKNGVLSIDFTKSGRTHFLTISDNGIGLPEGYDFQKANTLGLELVNILAGQLNGSVQIKSENGLEVVVIFETKRA